MILADPTTWPDVAMVALLLAFIFGLCLLAGKD